MVIRALVLILIWIFSATKTYASDLNTQGFSFVGKELVEIGPFGIDIYHASFYRKSDGQRLLELQYVRDIARRYSVMGWKKGLAHIGQDESSQNAADWIMASTPDFAKGDQFSILIKNGETSLFLNEKFIASSDDPRVAEIIHSPWLGEEPLQPSIKAGLLGE